MQIAALLKIAKHPPDNAQGFDEDDKSDFESDLLLRVLREEVKILPGNTKFKQQGDLICHDGPHTLMPVLAETVKSTFGPMSKHMRCR